MDARADRSVVGKRADGGKAFRPNRALEQTRSFFPLFLSLPIRSGLQRYARGLGDGNGLDGLINETLCKFKRRIQVEPHHSEKLKVRGAALVLGDKKTLVF